MGKNVGLSIVAYFFGLIGGIVVYLVADKRDRFTRFHAMQSILFNIAFGVIALILGALSFPFWFIRGGVPLLGFPALIGFGVVWFIYGVVAFVLWLVLMIRAYHGEKYKLPLVGDLAEDWSK